MFVKAVRGEGEGLLELIVTPHSEVHCELLTRGFRTQRLRKGASCGKRRFNLAELSSEVLLLL